MILASHDYKTNIKTKAINITRNRKFGNKNILQDRVDIVHMIVQCKSDLIRIISSLQFAIIY